MKPYLKGIEKAFQSIGGTIVSQNGPDRCACGPVLEIWLEVVRLLGRGESPKWLRKT